MNFNRLLSFVLCLFMAAKVASSLTCPTGYDELGIWCTAKRDSDGSCPNQTIFDDTTKLCILIDIA